MTHGHYRSKPVSVEAVQFTGWVNAELRRFLDKLDEAVWCIVGNEITIRTPKGDRLVPKGDWIVKNEDGELYHCGPDIFEDIYHLWYSVYPPLVPRMFTDGTVTVEAVFYDGNPMKMRMLSRYLRADGYSRAWPRESRFDIFTIDYSVPSTEPIDKYQRDGFSFNGPAWIVKDTDGQFRPYEPKSFEKRFTEVSELKTVV